MKPGTTHILAASLVLATFALIGSTLLAVTEKGTRSRIVANELALLERSLHQVVPESAIDNDLVRDTRVISQPSLLGEPATTIFTGRRQGVPGYVALKISTPDGYNGRISLMIGVDAMGRISGVRALKHQETPGLGDDIELKRSDWVLGFDGRSLGDPTLPGWQVKRDGGQFPQFTGATITPRAVVGAVARALQFVNENSQMLFAQPEAGESGVTESPQ